MTQHAARGCSSPLGRLVLLVASAVALGAPVAARAQWSTVSDQFYLPGSFNWQFRHNYPAADRLFNAFDYGHAILYERLYTNPGAPVSSLEEKEYNFITRKLLVTPPRVPLEEAAIEVAYAKLAPEAKTMFDWAHLLHRQIYDVWSDERLSLDQKDAKVAELVRYYKSRPDVAFSSQPKTMELMEGQYYSTAFREKYPKFNGLIWAYHWMQVGLYEPLVTGKTLDERQTGVIAAVARFRQMLERAPTNMPRIMPMTAAIAPAFATRYPEAAIIFDNLHAMHDVVSDILTSPKVPRNRKRAEILKAAARYRDATSFVMTPQEWRDMAQMMGVQNMGGPAVAFLADFPTPTVERGALMLGMEHGKMNGMAGMSGMSGAAGTPNDSMPGMNHGNMSQPTSGMATADSAHSMSNMPGMKGMSGMGADSNAVKQHDAMNMGTMDTGSMSGMQMHMRMLADPVIRQRIATDTSLRRMMTEMIGQMPASHQAMMRQMLDKPAAASSPTRKTTPRKASTAKKAPATKKAEPKKKPPMDMNMPGMDHSKMPGMVKP